MIKTFNQAVKYLERFVPAPEKKYPGELGLLRMEYLMNLLGNPQFRYPTIHVGGTSGKGSTATIIASILATKYKVGLHTSPHLVKITERIRIYDHAMEISSIPNFSDTPPSGNLKIHGPISTALHTQSLIGRGRSSKLVSSDISAEEFINLINYMRPFVEKVEESKFDKPSYFEIVTAMAFLYFYQQKVDIAVIEVGMGGRFDATNVIMPLVSVLTNIGLDHTEILGDTVEKIAEDKAGIIKSGMKVVSGVKQTSVIQIIKAVCSRCNSSLSLLNKDFSYRIKRVTEKGSVFDYFGENTYRNLKLALLGEHQVENAVIAIRVIEISRGPLAEIARSPLIKEKDIRLGLSNAFIPGRLEIISRNPLVILDGAHNLDKVKALTDSIKKIFPKKKITAIVAIKNDKNAREMLAKLLEISSKVIFTKFELTADIGVISSYDPKDLLKIANGLYSSSDEQSEESRSLPRAGPRGSRQARTIKPDLRVIPNSQKALGKAVRLAKSDDLILVTGSLYLLGEIKSALSVKGKAESERK